MEETVFAMGVTESFETVIMGWDGAAGAAVAEVPYETDALPALSGGMASGNGVVLLTSEAGDMIAVEPAAGTVRWRAANGRGVQGTPLIVGDTVLYITADHHLFARSLTDGALLGDFALHLFVRSNGDGTMSPLLVDGALYAAFHQHAFALPLR
jgi:outer membrane protein assembly factor BamB